MINPEKLFPASNDSDGTPWNDEQKSFIRGSAVELFESLRIACNNDGDAVCAIAMSIVEIVLDRKSVV